MEPDPDVLWAFAVETLDEDERGDVLAWLVGTIDQPGHTDRSAAGERDVVLLLRDRLVVVVVQPDQYTTWTYRRDQVANVGLAPGHLRFDAFDDESWTLIEFWIDEGITPAGPFEEQLHGWQVTEESSAGGCGVVAFGLALAVAALALLYAFGPADWNPVDSRLNARSTCGEFLRAGEDRQLDLLRRLFGEAGRPADAEKPAVLTQSRRRCEENGSVTLDSLVTGR